MRKLNLATLLSILCLPLAPADSSHECFKTELKSLLSPGASIYFPGSEEFEVATERWQNWQPPRFLAAVEVATSKDVQETVQFANRIGLPFLAVTGGHGGVGTLGRLDHGIEIWLRRLDSIGFSEDEKSVHLGGGLLVKEVTDALWAKGKQTTTGLCECVGMVGPMLGGGHGVLQGRYGLVADNMLEAEVVLADGSITIASATSNPDLFWALKGAGHNFGIVTKYTKEIYDVPPNNSWVADSYIYTQDKLEALLEVTNSLTEAGNQPVEFLNWAYYIWLPDIDAESPVIQYTVLYEGTSEQAEKYTSAYRRLDPTTITSETVSYLDLPKLTGNANSDFGCQHGYSVLQYPISLYQYNVTAHRMVFDLFTEYTTAYPGLNNSFIMNEGYSLKGVQSVPAESTAYPDRDGNLLIAPIMIFFDENEEEHANIAGDAMRKILLEGSGSPRLDAYVNYVSMGESVEEIYGHESWRITKLRGLKKKFDPENRFRFYAPIV